MAKSLTGADIIVVRSGVVRPFNNDGGGDGYDDADKGTEDGRGDPWWDGDDDNPGW